MTKTRLLIGAILMVHMQVCLAGQVRVRTLDEAGVKIPNILVVARSLNSAAFFQVRFLTDSDGQTPLFELPRGLYQFIAICPFGLWRGSITELLVNDSTKTIILPVKAKSGIDVIETDKRRAVSIHLFSSSSGSPPLPGISVMTRDTDGGNESWLRTDVAGRTEANLTDGPTILVVPMEERILTFVLLDDCKAIDRVNWNRALLPPKGTCVSVKSRTVEIEIPESKPEGMEGNSGSN